MENLLLDMNRKDGYPIAKALISLLTENLVENYDLRIT